MGDAPTIQNNFIYETKNVNGKTTYTGRINEAIYVVDGDTLRFVYEYDIFSNITKITKYVNNVVDYIEENIYDIFNQLTKQTLTKENVTYSTSYTYDSRGNVTSIIENNETEGEITNSIIFTYNDRNELLSVNDNGSMHTNSYSSKGMLTTYLDWNISYDMRNISSLNNSETTLDFEYNADGIRISKIIDDVTTVNYVLDGVNILKEIISGTSNYQVEYYYDSNDNVIGFKYDNNHYIYLKDMQNDIIGIIDSNGNLVVEYMYDAYGNIYNMIDNSGISLGTINPFRYRSYYFDNETGWYYLNSRYYNPKLARFVTMDEIEYLGVSESVLSYNLYSYCENNAINNSDKEGHVVTPANVIGAAIGAVIGAVGGYFLSRYLADRLNLKGWKRTLFITGITAVITAGAGVIGYFIGPYVAKAATKVINSLKTLIKRVGFKSRGSTGRTVANSLKEKLAMEEVKSAAKSGKVLGKVIIDNLKDPRWLSTEGWVKIAKIVNGVEIHYVYNEILGIFDDFKFK